MERDNGTKTLLFGVIIAVAVFFQVTLVHLAPKWLSPWLKYIDWILLLTIYIARQREMKKWISLLMATFCGIVFDSLSGWKGVGVSGLGYLMAAWFTIQFTSRIPAEHVMVRFGVVSIGSVISNSTRLLFYSALGLTLPVLAGVHPVVANLVFTLIFNLIASVPLYLLLDLLFQPRNSLSRRRKEARRQRL